MTYEAGVGADRVQHDRQDNRRVVAVLVPLVERVGGISDLPQILDGSLVLQNGQLLLKVLQDVVRLNERRFFFFFFLGVGASYSTRSYRQGYKRKPPDKEQRTKNRGLRTKRLERLEKGNKET